MTEWTGKFAFWVRELAPLVATLGLVVTVQTVAAQPFTVPTASMVTSSAEATGPTPPDN